MIDTQKLKGKMVEKGYTQKAMAKEMGMSERTFNAKLKKGVFNNLEIQKMVDILRIEKPLNIFFV